MKLNTCTGCRFARNCDHASFLRKSLKGYGIRSIKFACAKRDDVFSPGQPVFFQTWITDGDGEFGQRVKVVFQGYAIEQRGGRVFGFIKPNTLDTDELYEFEAKSNGYVNIPLARVKYDKSRPNGDVRLCRWCGSHPGIGARCGIDLNYTPRGECLSQKINDALSDARELEALGRD